MTNLLIGYPQVPFLGSLIASTTAASSYAATNAITGPRCEHYKASASVVQTRLDFNYGSAIAPDFMVLARADLVRYGDSTDSTVSLVGATDSGISSGVVTYATTLTTGLLYGPNNEDLIVYPVGAASKQYWRVQVDTTASFQHRFSKVYFGNAFDLGREPITPKKLIRYPASNLARTARYKFNLEWQGITNLVRGNFDTYIYQYKDTNPVFLFTTSYHDLLNEHRVIHCKINTVRWTPQDASLNKLEIEFEEAI